MRLGNSGASVSASALEMGVWRQTPFGSMRVKLRHPDSIAYRRAIRDRRAQFETMLDDVAREDGIRRAIVAASIVDIDGAVDVDGNSISYSQEIIDGIVDNPDNKPFVDWVSVAVIDLGSAANFETLLKNLESVLPGN